MREPPGVTHNVINMGECNRCTLEKKLPVPYREALGLK
jgi:hypothetical protein